MRKQVFVAALIAGLAVIVAGCDRGTDSPSTDAVATSSEALAPLVDPNNAERATLAGVPGLSEAAVELILAQRPFANPSALHAALLTTLEEGNIREAYGAMFIQLDLNTAAEEDIKLIPSSLSPRKLAHEFDEYRPYSDVAQFVREMSKYVSDEEAAALARYVTLAP